MAQVNIIRHNPIAIFSNPTEVIITDDNGDVVRLIEPSGNVGTQYANDIGSEWFGTIENLNKGLQICGVSWSDVYKTDVLWTTPSADRDECDQFKNDFNACYGAMINAVTGGPLRSNRMARFTHQEGFPDPAALFEVQIKAVVGETVNIGGGKIDYGTWVDHQPSGASVLHKGADGEMVTTLGDDLVEEMNFILAEQYAKGFAEQGIDFKKQTVFMEILVAVDDDPAVTWERIEATRKAFEAYYGDDRPAGLIYPVSRIPNLDSIIEPQPRVVSGEVEIHRSGQLEDGFSTWAGFSHHGVREVQVSAVAGNDAAAQLGTLDARIKEAGGAGLKEDAVFNNAYISAGDDSAANRASIGSFNESFSAYYEGTKPAGRTAQFVGGCQREGQQSGISTRAIFAE
jgi:enamine deaminase RidA (YjgF/YER057c/UK114 family)